MRDELPRANGTDDVGLIGFSPAMRQAIGAAVDVAGAPTTVLLTGETGSGKEVLARFIHQISPRAGLPLSVLSGIALDLEQVEAALRHGGTVVLDEIAAIPMETQGRLLAILEGTHPSRLIATSHRDLRELVERGQLRSDLFYRLDVYPIVVPPLRARREDLPSLTDVLIARIAAALGRPPLRLTGEALGVLEGYRWPGNVRELANVLERALIRTRGQVIEAADLGLPAPTRSAAHEPSMVGFPAHLPLDLVALERVAIAEALRRTNGNRTHAARLLNIGLRTLRQKLNTPSSPEGSTASSSEGLSAVAP
ncbi:MAG: sigma 54-interacting transcriptional regulator [Myxococcota bacterium]